MAYDGFVMKTYMTILVVKLTYTVQLLQKWSDLASFCRYVTNGLAQGLGVDRFV